jgi:hypothetical protein
MHYFNSRQGIVYTDRDGTRLKDELSRIEFGNGCNSNKLARWPDPPDDKSTGYQTMPDQSG